MNAQLGQAEAQLHLVVLIVDQAPIVPGDAIIGDRLRIDSDYLITSLEHVRKEI